MHAEAVKKRRRTTKKPYSRSIVGASLEVIQKKRAEKPEVRDAAREAALRYVFCRIVKLLYMRLMTVVVWCKFRFVFSWILMLKLNNINE
jgi:hypothetical protein